MSGIVAMILAGGRVDELDVLTFERPKSVVPFGGLYRIIDFPMSNLMYSGIEKVGILSQYRPLHLINHVANGLPWDMMGRNRFAVILPPFKGREAADWYKGTADAVYQNLDFIRMHDPDLVMVLSGDHIYRMDYQQLAAFHREKKADVTIAFTPMPKEGGQRFGQAQIDEGDERGGRVLKYAEKPRKALFDWASLTIYLFRPSALYEALEENARRDSHEFGKDILPALVDRAAAYGYKHRGYWGYARTLQEYWTTNMELLGRKPAIDPRAWGIRTNLSHQRIQDRQPAIIGPSARIEDSLFYSGCEIRGRVVRSLLFPGVIVEEGAVVKDSVLFFDTKVGRDARVTKTIADVRVHVGDGARVGGSRWEDLTVVGLTSAIPDGVTLQAGVTVYPRVNTSHFVAGTYRKGDIVK